MPYPNTVKVAVLSSVLLVVSIFSFSYPTAHAYGPAQWQTAFSGNFNNPGVNATGFWGWCEFAASAPDGMSGTESDCQVSNYFFNTTVHFGPIHMSVKGTAWSMKPSTFPLLPIPDFFVTDGSLTITGPILRTPPPPGCTISGQIVTCVTPSGTFTCAFTGQSLTCSIPAAKAIGIYRPDTGIPAKAGHYSLANILEMFGVELPPASHINVQVNQLP